MKEKIKNTKKGKYYKYFTAQHDLCCTFSVIEHLPNMHKPLSSISNAETKQKQTQTKNSPPLFFFLWY
jgi:hypothetical protein